MDVIYLLEEYKDVINIKDLCEILNIGKNTAYKLLKNNDIPNRRLPLICHSSLTSVVC